jgi:hypothetical protein
MKTPPLEHLDHLVSLFASSLHRKFQTETDLHRHGRRQLSKTERPVVANRLRDQLQIESLTIHSQLRVRPFLSFEVLQDSEHITIEFNNKEVQYPLTFISELHYVISHSTFFVYELLASLEEAAAIAFCKRLIEEGLLTFVLQTAEVPYENS